MIIMKKLGRIRKVLRTVRARGQLAVLIWVVEMGLFEKGLLNRGFMWLYGGRT